MKNKSYLGLTDRLLPKGGFKATTDQFKDFMGQIPGYNPQKPKMMPKPIKTYDTVDDYIMRMEKMGSAERHNIAQQRKLDEFEQRERMKNLAAKGGRVGDGIDRQTLSKLEYDLSEANRLGDPDLAARIQRSIGAIQGRSQQPSSSQQMMTQLRK